MKIKIVNKKKFIKNISVLIAVLIISLLFINNKALSHKEMEYKSVYVSNGDTLWNIAKNEQIENKYYEGKDIRDIMESIKKVNNLTTSSLQIEQMLEIPTI